jgi:hypothetical protein
MCTVTGTSYFAANAQYGAIRASSGRTPVYTNSISPRMPILPAAISRSSQPGSGQPFVSAKHR